MRSSGLRPPTIPRICPWTIIHDYTFFADEPSNQIIALTLFTNHNPSHFPVKREFTAEKHTAQPDGYANSFFTNINRPWCIDTIVNS